MAFAMGLVVLVTLISFEKVFYNFSPPVIIQKYLTCLNKTCQIFEQVQILNMSLWIAV